MILSGDKQNLDPPNHYGYKQGKRKQRQLECQWRGQKWPSRGEFQASLLIKQQLIDDVFNLNQAFPKLFFIQVELRV